MCTIRLIRPETHKYCLKYFFCDESEENTREIIWYVRVSSKRGKMKPTKCSFHSSFNIWFCLSLSSLRYNVFFFWSTLIKSSLFIYAPSIRFGWITLFSVEHFGASCERQRQTYWTWTICHCTIHVNVYETVDFVTSSHYSLCERKQTTLQCSA